MVIVSSVVYRERVDYKNLLGLAMGYAGALLCILSEPSAEVASSPLLGNMLAIVSSIIYAVYLVMSGRMVGHLSSVTILRYTFSSGAVVSLLLLPFIGFHAPVFEGGYKLMPTALLAFVLLVPTVITYFLIPVMGIVGAALCTC